MDGEHEPKEKDLGQDRQDPPTSPMPGGLKPARPDNEEARIGDLHDLGVLDSAAELDFDHLVQTAALIAGTKIAALSLVDKDRQWFKSSTGIEGTETPRDVSFCAHAINEPDKPFIVEDAASDPRFADNPLVAHSPGIGFYAGIPVVSANGHAVGTICVADQQPGSLSDEQIEALRGISRQATALLELRRRTKTLGAVLERERRRAAEFMEWQRTHDATTALPMRELLDKRINQMADAALLNGRVPTTSVLAIDISGFSNVNAAFGREAGDAVMRELAWLLAESLPADAMLARTDGTSFAAVVPDADLSLVGAVAHSIHERLTIPVAASGVEAVTLSAVIGCASCGEGGSIDPRLMLPAAEAACAEAKALGPRSTVSAGSETGSAIARNSRMREALAAAIRAEALTVAYMPLVRLADRKVSGVEALARWRDPEFGQVSPEEFIALAEQHGMVKLIDDFVMRTALADFATGRLDSETVAVNVSPAGVDSDLTARIQTALEEAGVEPERLSVEITERAGLNDSPRICSALEDLRSLGVKVALDDFGAGATSIAHLRSLPISHLKIDRSLVADLVGPDAERAKMVISAIADMATGLGLETLGEGVETPEQAEALTDAGVRFAQGMLFGAPAALPMADLA